MPTADRQAAPRTNKGVSRVAAQTALAVITLVYLRTMPPGLVGVGRGLWDSQEIQVVGVAWGYSHPPGYPLQSLLANLLAHSIGALPGVEPAWGVSLLSALAMILAAGSVYQIVRRLTGNEVAAVLAMVVFAFSLGPWHTALTPEVYPLNLALWGLAFWLSIYAAEAGSPRVDFLLGLTMGLAMGHHRIAFLLAPGAILYLGIERRWSVAWKRLLLGVLLSVGIYLYLPLAHAWRSPMVPHEVHSVWDLLKYVRASSWAVFFQVPASLAEFWSRLELSFDALRVQVGRIGAVLGLAGLAWLVWGPPLSLSRLALFGLPALGLLAFGVMYQVPDVATMLGPLSMILCIGLGGLAAGLLSAVRRLASGARGTPVAEGHWPSAPSFWFSILSWLLVLAVSGGLLTRNYAQVDESWDRRGQSVMAELACELKGTPTEVWLTAESGYAGSLVAYMARRIGRPLVWANPWGEWDYLGALNGGRRVFLVKDMPGTWQYPEALTRLVGPQRYLMPTSSPDLLEAVDASLPPPADPAYTSLGEPFGSAIVLQGYALHLCRSGAGTVLRLALYWQAQSQPDQNWRVKAHLLSQDGTLIAQADREHPVRGARPTTSWQPGQIVRDVYDYRLPPRTDLAGAQIVVGLYQIIGTEFPSLGEVTIEIEDTSLR